MDPDKQKELASKGGRSAHQRGHAHEFNEDEARAAGRKGGERVSRDRAYMVEIGRRGGLARAQRGKERADANVNGTVSAPATAHDDSN